LVNPTPAQIISGGACPVSLPDFILTSQAEVDAFDYSYVPANLVVMEDVPGNITNLNALSNLTGVEGTFSIVRNSNLSNLNGLSSLTSIRGDLDIENDPSLNNIDALSNLTNISSLQIDGTALTNLNGLSHLTIPINNIKIGSNPFLTSISALAGLQNAHTVNIGFNDLLTSLNGLQGTITPDNIIIENNNALTDLNGINNVASANFLAIRNNAVLPNLDGLSGLHSVGGDPNSLAPSFDIHNNAQLTNLNGLFNLDNVDGNLLVANNVILSNFCGLYHLLSTDGLGGSYRVVGNATNPTQQQILDAGPCAPSTVRPSVTINQSPGQADPTTISPINFTVQFDQSVTGFTSTDMMISGTAGATTAVVTEITPNNGTTYNVAVSGMTTSGTVIASIPTNAAFNTSAQGNTASTSVDNTVTYINNTNNTCPVANNITIATAGGTPVNLQLQGSDGNNDPLVYSISQNAAHGTATTSASGAANYTPNANYYGTDQFKYKVSDGKCDAEATVNITIVNCPKGSGYWKNHPEAWPSSAIPMLLGTRSYTKTQLLSILNMQVGNGNNADASLKLAQQEIAAKLNLANGSPTAANLPTSLSSADVLIGNNAIPMKVRPNTALGQSMITIADFLASYNNGLLTDGCHEPALTSAKQTTTMSESVGISSVNGFEVKIYPNPSSTDFQLKIATSNMENILIQVVDMYGRIIETRNVNANSIIQLGDRYRPGTYFVRIIQREEHKEIKLIKLSQ